MGDLRLVSKVRLLSTAGGLHVGLLVPIVLPTAGGNAFRGGGGMSVQPKVLGEWTFGGTRVLSNLGVNFRRTESLYNLDVGHELTYGLGVEVPFGWGAHQFSAAGTLVGAWGLGQDTDFAERPLGLLAAVKYRVVRSLTAHLGAGTGLTRGYGTPNYRILAGLLWTVSEDGR